MGLYVVKESADLKALTGKLLEPRARRAVRDAAIDKLRRANPTLDLDNLRPGTIVVVPAMEGRRRNIDTSGESATEALAESLTGALDSLAEGTGNAVKEAKAHLKATRRVLDSDPIKRAAERDQEFGETIRAWAESSERDLERESAQADAAKETVAEWKDELESLKKMLD